MEKIFFIDDDPFMHLIFQKILRNYKDTTQVTYSYDSRDMVAFLDTHKRNIDILPEYIFVDINMPVFDGWDFLNGIANFYLQFAKKISVYVVSSSIDPNHIKKAKNYPFVTDYIIKPLVRKKLESILNEDLLAG